MSKKEKSNIFKELVLNIGKAYHMIYSLHHFKTDGFPYLGQSQITKLKYKNVQFELAAQSLYLAFTIGCEILKSKKNKIFPGDKGLGFDREKYAMANIKVVVSDILELLPLNLADYDELIIKSEIDTAPGFAIYHDVLAASLVLKKFTK